MKDENKCQDCKYWFTPDDKFPCNDCSQNHWGSPAFHRDFLNRYQPKTEESETVNHPKHYQGKHECIDEMIALFGVEAVKAFCRCNVYKYRYRADKKNGAEDIAKAEWYMDKLMELERESYETY